MFTEAEKKILLGFLEDLSDKYGNAGCNDYRLPNTSENKQILCAAIKIQYEKDAVVKEVDRIMRIKGDTILTFDSLVLDYFIDKLGEGG